MKSLLCIGFIATLAAAGCDKKKNEPTPVPTTSTDSKAVSPPPATPPATTAVATSPPAAADAKETVSKTGVLDMELSDTPGHYTLRDDAYQIVFPLKPKVEGADQPTPAGVTLKTLSALANTDDDVYGYFLIPIPKGMPYDIEAGLNGARDGAIGNIHGTLISEVDTTLGGLKGRKSTATAQVAGREMRLEIYLAFDKPHTTMIGMFTGGFAKDPPQTAKDFISSFKVNAAGKGPPAGNGK